MFSLFIKFLKNAKTSLNIYQLRFVGNFIIFLLIMNFIVFSSALSVFSDRHNLLDMPPFDLFQKSQNNLMILKKQPMQFELAMRGKELFNYP